MPPLPPLRIAQRNPADHKGTFGRVLLVGGSRGMAGSIALSAIAALKSGSGLVAAAVPDSILETVAGFHPAVMTIPINEEAGHFGSTAAATIQELLERQDAIGCGPGMTTQEGCVGVVDQLLRSKNVPLVLDADALNIIAKQRWIQSARFDRASERPSMVWTPHAREYERLSGVSASDRQSQIQSAIETTDRTGATLVLKGGPTVVIGRTMKESGIEVWTNDTGNPGMATAGSGDVLTGVITSLLGQGLSAWDAARLGVWWHGRAGDIARASKGQLGMTSADVLESLTACGNEVT